MIPKKCKNCGKIIKTRFKSKLKKRKYCSQKCDREYRRKNGLYKLYQKKRKDLILNQMKLFKQMSNKKINYKDLSETQKKVYHRLHTYIRRTKEIPLLCEECNKNKPNILANISGKYKKDIKDYKWVCRSCHNKMDKLVSNFKEAYLKMKRNKYGRFGKEKSLGIIKCKKCESKIIKKNPKQKYCIKCRVKYNLGHYSKSELNKRKMKNDNKNRRLPVM